MPEQPNPIKEAFAKAKQDIFSLASEIASLKREIFALKETIKLLSNIPTVKQTDNPAHSSTENPTQKAPKSALQHINTTEKDIPAHNPAQNRALYGLKTEISNFSIGNEGVPADSQTVKQTDNKHINKELTEPLNTNISQKLQHIDNQTTHQHTPQHTEIDLYKTQKKLESVSQVLESLDSIKKELRQKFKRLTQQEMTVFSAIYQLEEEGFIVNYPMLSQKLQLTESSIRDYIQRLLKKGIPLVKNKENNKKILLSLSSELKRIASLSAIIQLREL